jgi:hypothetical protein
VKILYSVDTDLTDLSVCDNAFRGINDVHAGTGLQVGLYGEGGLIERLHGMGSSRAASGCRCPRASAASPTRSSPGLVAVVQMHDAAGNWIGTDIPGTDRNTIIDPHTPRRLVARIVVVDRKDCARLKVRWPGWFLVTPRGAAATPAIEHIDSTSRLHALQATGLPSKTITVATYRGLGGK